MLAADGKFTPAMVQAIVDENVNWGNRLVVNYEDPRWQEIDSESYAYISEGATVDHFPVLGKGEVEVEFDIHQFDHEPTTTEIIEWQNENGYRPADRAETETYLDVHKAACQQNPIVGICGKESEGSGVRRIGEVSGHRNGRLLNIRHFHYEWLQFCRFIRVKK
ncbi:MAG: hypothetical protein ABIG66_01320 [Candidatus Kerfeldbacteria bacterium]